MPMVASMLGIVKADSGFSLLILPAISMRSQCGVNSSFTLLAIGCAVSSLIGCAVSSLIGCAALVSLVVLSLVSLVVLSLVSLVVLL